MKNSRGASNIGCLFTLAVVVCGFYVGYKFAVVQWNLEPFKEQMTEVTRYWAQEGSENIMLIKAEVIRRAAVCNFDLSNQDIAVDNEGPSLTITASWLEPIIFPGGYVYEREIAVSRTIKKPGY